MNNVVLKKAIINVIGVAGIAACSSFLQAASFDCAKAAAPIEKLICSDETTSKLDADLAGTYKAVMKKAENKDELKQQQRNWLKEKRNACKDAACLMQAYQARIAELSEAANRVSDIYSSEFKLVDYKKIENKKLPLTFKLSYGDSYPICQPYVDMLNKTKYMEYPTCERKILPEYKQFKALVWEEVASEDEKLNFIGEGIRLKHASMWGVNDLRYQSIQKSYRTMIINKKSLVFKAKSNIDSHGKDETVYALSLSSERNYSSEFCHERILYYVFDSSISNENIKMYEEKGYSGINFTGNNQLITINNVLHHEHWNPTYGVEGDKETVSIWNIANHKEKICGIDIE